jgi:hypothetical protein
VVLGTVRRSSAFIICRKHAEELGSALVNGRLVRDQRKGDENRDSARQRMADHPVQGYGRDGIGTGSAKREQIDLAG